jgi:hypothetical protein
MTQSVGNYISFLRMILYSNVIILDPFVTFVLSQIQVGLDENVLETLVVTI